MKQNQNSKSPLGDFNVRCPNCGHVFKANLSDLNWDWQRESVEERGMGAEIQHLSEDNIECPKCGTDIPLVFNVWEYPVGIINHKSCDIGDETEADVNFDDYLPDLSLE